MKIKYIFSISSVLLISLLIYTLYNQSKEKFDSDQATDVPIIDENSHSDQVADTPIMDENTYSVKNVYNLEINKSYTTSMELYANNSPEMNGADPPEFLIPANSLVILIELQNDFAKIQFSDKEGWIPSWYLSTESKDIIIESPYARVIDTPTSEYLYPTSNKTKYNYDYKIEQGKAIKVIAQYSDYICIKYRTYDCPYYDLTWVKKADTCDYDVELVREGHIRENAVIYTKKNIKTGKKISGSIIITKDNTTDLYHASGIGGQVGYIKKVDFIPFSEEQIINFPNY